MSEIIAQGDGECGTMTRPGAVEAASRPLARPAFKEQDVADTTIPEEWRAVERFHGYEISNLGRVRSFRRFPDGPPTIISPFKNPDGYWQVRLARGSVAKPICQRLHRLVAVAFLGRDPFRLIVNHKNGIKQDNRAENLEWVTDQENTRHAIRLGLKSAESVARGSRIGIAKLNDDSVRECRKMFNSGVSKTKIARVYGVNFATIDRIVRGLTWRHVIDSNALESLRTAEEDKT